VEGSRILVYFLYLTGRLWKCIVTFAVTGNTIFGPVSVVGGCQLSEASTAVHLKSMEHTVAERSCKDADFLCNSCVERGGYGKVL
jgi:hypothetical protein